MQLVSRHRIGALSLALLVSALLAPSALAGRPDDQARHGVGAVTAQTATPDVIERAYARAVTSTPDVFERAVTRQTNQVQAPAAVPDAFERAVSRFGVTRPDDRAATRGPGAYGAPQTTALPGDGGVTWTTALLGISATLGLGLLIAASSLVVTRRRRVVLH